MTTQDTVDTSKLTSEVTKWTQSLDTTFPQKKAGFFHIENSELAKKLVFLLNLDIMFFSLRFS